MNINLSNLYYYYPILTTGLRFGDVLKLGESAVSRFGTNPEPFREVLVEYSEAEFKKTILERSCKTPASCLRFSSSIITEYINCLIAILQVDLEVPGFKNNFPEATDFIVAVNGRNINQIVWEFERYYDEVIEDLNRYSGKHDLGYIEKLFEIPTDSKTRSDDYVAARFLYFWTNGDPEMKGYLGEYYMHKETLLPPDYKEILGLFELTDNKKYKDDSLKWVDLYFSKLDDIMGKLEIEYISPDIMKKINLTLTNP